MNQSLEGKTAIVTGGSRGIGKGIAKAFAEAKANVVITARNARPLADSAKEIEEAGGKVHAIEMDVSVEEDALRMVEETLSTFGQVDVLVNNAGVVDPDHEVWETTVEDWDRLMSTNLRGAFLCTRAVLPHMMERRTGHIVNLVSIFGRLATNKYGAYTASKWGLMGYTASLAKSLRPYRIRVNAVSPDWVYTEITPTLPVVDTDSWSTVEEVADATLFLVTSASQDMTGQSMDLFGMNKQR